MLRIFSVVIIIVSFVVLLVLGMGYTADPDFSGSQTEVFQDNRQVVWNLITDPEVSDIRKRDVHEVETISNNRGLLSWKEHLDNGGFRLYQMIKKRTPSELVVELTQSTTGLTGTWTYELRTTDDNKTQVTLTEESYTDSLWRRGLDSVRGRDNNLVQEMKSIRVGLFQRLLQTR